MALSLQDAAKMLETESHIGGTYNVSLVPWLFTDTSEHIRFFLLVFFFHFLVFGSVR